jgi:hypothetical protein
MNKPKVLVKYSFAGFEARRGLIPKITATANIATTRPRTFIEYIQKALSLNLIQRGFKIQPAVYEVFH